jgi:hypothetical protein
LATLIAAMRRGWVQPIMPRVPQPAARQHLGIWVVLPEPVSPEMITTRLVWMALMMASFLAVMGRSCGKFSWAGLFSGDRTNGFRAGRGFLGKWEGFFCIMNQ